jgi:hypothetical protein
MNDEDKAKWPTLPFETRLHHLKALVFEKLSLAVKQNRDANSLTQAAWCNLTLDELFMVWEHWEPSSPVTFAPAAFNEKPTELKLRLLEFAIDTIESSERLLRTVEKSYHPNIVSATYLKERKEQASNFIDALTFKVKP